MVKADFLQLFDRFHAHNLDLKEINRANIIMIPKKEGPKTVSDFRPISVINLFSKLLSKVLANRLSTLLPKLIFANQTAFMRGRYIAENFIATRELLHHIHVSGNPAIFMKINFSKAFDSVDWEFLLKVMQARGFPQRWIRWINQIFVSSSSRVVINGQESSFFFHKKGLRQGDPLSPMLFVLAVDVLQQLLLNANELLSGRITTKI
jgi:Reverse transcriptase (RNA-dependent DNA polymerase)